MAIVSSKLQKSAKGILTKNLPLYIMYQFIALMREPPVEEIQEPLPYGDRELAA